jgi:hypothetical protein
MVGIHTGYLISFIQIQPVQKTIDEIVGKYDNLKNVNSFSTITGKEANATYKIQTRFNVLYKEYITSILTSPSVEMYVHQIQSNRCK